MLLAMPGKRKEETHAIIESSSSGAGNGNVKPISAVSAAKLKQRPQEIIDKPVTTTSDSLLDDIESDSEGNLEEQPLEVQPNVQLCTWRYGQDYVASETQDELTVSLKKNSTITLIGNFFFEVLEGAININGANFGANRRKDKTKPIRLAFAPSTHPISSIKGLDGTNRIQFKDCGDEATSLTNLSPLFVNIWNAKMQSTPARSFAQITDSGADPLGRFMYPELVPEDWIRQIEECTGSSSTLVVGPPSSGKSMFAKRLLNRYLTGLGKIAQAVPSVYFLDLDAHNPAYSPHGQISLVTVREVDLGPPFTHPSIITTVPGECEVVRAHAVPIQTASGYQDHFLSCVDDLVQTYASLRHQHPSTPLIINTPGWLYMTSYNHLLRLVSLIKPQQLVHLADLQSIDEKHAENLNALDAAARKHGISAVHISSQTNSNTPSRTDAELRSMYMLSYFHCTGITDTNPPQRTYNRRPLSHSKPWELCYEASKELSQNFVGFLMLSDWSEPSQLFTILNGSIVNIVETHDATIQQQYGTLPRTKNSRIPYFEKSSSGRVEPLDPKTSRLICTALLRGFDVNKRIAQLVIPKTHEALMHSLAPDKTVLVFGCCEHPEWAYSEDAYYEMSQQATNWQMEEKIVSEGLALSPWVTKATAIEEMGYMNTPRRVRKFQQ